MKYLLIIGHDDDFGPSPDLIKNILAWNAELRRQKILLDSHPLRPWSEAKTLRVRQGQIEVTAGSFSESAEKVSAYALIDCRSEAEALAVAARHPMAAVAVIELRPVWDDIGG